MTSILGFRLYVIEMGIYIAALTSHVSYLQTLKRDFSTVAKISIYNYCPAFKIGSYLQV